MYAQKLFVIFFISIFMIVLEVNGMNQGYGKPFENIEKKSMNFRNRKRSKRIKKMEVRVNDPYGCKVIEDYMLDAETKDEDLSVSATSFSKMPDEVKILSAVVDRSSKVIDRSSKVINRSSEMSIPLTNAPRYIHRETDSRRPMVVQMEKIDSGVIQIDHFSGRPMPVWRQEKCSV